MHVRALSVDAANGYILMFSVYNKESYEFIKVRVATAGETAENGTTDEG